VIIIIVATDEGCLFFAKGVREVLVYGEVLVKFC
jgi:hypothetical protein